MRMKGFPQKVRLMGKTFRLEYVDRVDHAEDLAGSCEAHKCLIRIDRNQADPALRDTIIHEATHALWNAIMSDIEDDRLEERVVLFTTITVRELYRALGRGFFEGLGE